MFLIGCDNSDPTGPWYNSRQELMMPTAHVRRGEIIEIYNGLNGELAKLQKEVEELKNVKKKPK